MKQFIHQPPVVHKVEFGIDQSLKKLREALRQEMRVQAARHSVKVGGKSSAALRWDEDGGNQAEVFASAAYSPGRPNIRDNVRISAELLEEARKEFIEERKRYLMQIRAGKGVMGDSPPVRAWYLRVKDGSVYGPVAVSALCEWAAQGRVAPSNEVSHDGEKWMPADSIHALSAYWTSGVFGDVHPAHGRAEDKMDLDMDVAEDEMDIEPRERIEADDTLARLRTKYALLEMKAQRLSMHLDAVAGRLDVSDIVSDQDASSYAGGIGQRAKKEKELIRNWFPGADDESSD